MCRLRERRDWLRTFLSVHNGIDEWSAPETPAHWRKVFDVSQDTLGRWRKSGQLRVKEVAGKRWQVQIADVRRLTSEN